jgi:hypothetical protein
MFKKIAVASLLAIAIGTAPAMAAETVSVVFTAANGGQTVGQYSGVVAIRAVGTGFSLASLVNDAFYDVASQSRNTGYYALGFGTAPLAGFTPSNNIGNFVVGAVPAFSASSVYNFRINTGLATPGTLYFGVTDGQYSDNGGNFRLTISAVPEAATWAMLIAGFGMVGFAARRRKLYAA